MGGLAVDDRRRAAPRSAEADAGSDLPASSPTRSGKPLRQIIRDTKRTDFYLDAEKAQEYGLIDDVLGDPAVPVTEARVTSESMDAGSRSPTC